MPASTVKNTRQIEISSEHENQRIDNFLFKHYKGVPKSRIYRALRSGEVKVNRKKVAQDYRLQAEDILSLPNLRMSEQTTQPRTSAIFLRNLAEMIIYEDNELMILNKPAGIAVHGGSGVTMGLVEGLRELRANPQINLCHRIDKETSGCLVLAKKRSILGQVHDLFRERLVEKTYLALVYGHWPKRIGKLTLSLTKKRLASGERIARVSSEGKPATTLFKVIKYYSDCTLLEIRPKTGRMHQIRIHVAHLGHPIVGDRKYANHALKREKRLYLHAAAIAFKLDNLDKNIAICACLDKDFCKML